MSSRRKNTKQSNKQSGIVAELETRNKRTKKIVTKPSKKQRAQQTKRKAKTTSKRVTPVKKGKKPKKMNNKPAKTKREKEEPAVEEESDNEEQSTNTSTNGDVSDEEESMASASDDAGEENSDEENQSASEEVSGEASSDCESNEEASDDEQESDEEQEIDEEDNSDAEETSETSEVEENSDEDNEASDEEDGDDNECDSEECEDVDDDNDECDSEECEDDDDDNDECDSEECDDDADVAAPEITGHFYGPDRIFSIREETSKLFKNIEAQKWSTVGVGYWPFHVFKKRSTAKPKNSFMQIYAQGKGKEFTDAYLMIWEDQCGPVGFPTHLICLMSDCEHKWVMGRSSKKMSKDQVRLVASENSSSKIEVPCFAVGKDKLLQFARLLSPFVSIVPRDRKKLFGAELKTFKSEELVYKE